MCDSKEDERAKKLGAEVAETLAGKAPQFRGIPLESEAQQTMADTWRRTQQQARLADEQTNALWRELQRKKAESSAHRPPVPYRFGVATEVPEIVALPQKGVRRSPADKMIRGRDLLNK